MSESQSTRISGTKEWSVASANCILGCSHRCRYCYAASNAIRRRQCPNYEAWGTTYLRVRQGEVRKRRLKMDGRVMFPTTHDIMPQFLDECIQVMQNILVADNSLLVVSKPHLSCVERICTALRMWRDRVLFRFSIGAMNDSILSYWEPGAPLFEERFASLRHAHLEGYGTSVSMEPLLDAGNVIEIVDVLAPHVTDSIWIGKMNQIGNRVALGTSAKEIARIKHGQSDDSVHSIYESLKSHRLIRWKESYKAVVGLALAQQAGLDI
jgi:DNA repair photolyase